MSIVSLSKNRLNETLKKNLSFPLVFLETVSPDKENKASFLFTGFSQILTFNSGDNPDIFFEKADNFLRKGFWLCGYFAYEFGYFLDPALYALRGKNKLPLAWLGVCERPAIINPSNPTTGFEAAGSPHTLKNIKSNITEREYSRSISKIKDYLKQGLTYQVNFTFKIKFDFKGDALSLYQNLKRSQPTPYTALINTGKNFILSLSPELFFRTNKNEIVSRPMKGTSGRGLTADDDMKNKKDLASSLKTRAENIMIVDLLRNDLGRVSKKVWTERIFEIEKHRTLYQMTSTIRGELKEGIKIKDIFTALFPCGSVTGASKIKTMEIIKGLEKEERGIYTGAIGYISPQRDACFNVAIRTLLLEGKKGEMGIGGGIVADSVGKYEYEEALLKARFLTDGFPEVSLIESILWESGKRFFLLSPHLKRLKSSCAYFSIQLDLNKLKCDLKNMAEELGKGKWKVRVLIDPRGKINIAWERLEEIRAPVKIKISGTKVDSRNIFLYHKTDRRGFYETELRRARRAGFFETVFLNTKGEVTEGSFTNIFVEKLNHLYTPPVKCGLLPGVLRAHLLRKKAVQEKILHLEDILQADKLYVGNSVRGLLEAEI